MKKYFILIITLFIISSVRVYALEDNDYYVNYYGIKISQYDYNRLLEYYSDDFIYSMNENEYEKVMENNLENVEVYSIGDFIDNNFQKRINLLTTEYKDYGNQNSSAKRQYVFYNNLPSSSGASVTGIYIGIIEMYPRR